MTITMTKRRRAPRLSPPAPPISEMQICSVYFPTTEAAVNAGFTPITGAHPGACTLLELPAEQYRDARLRVRQHVDGLGAERHAAPSRAALRLRQGTVSYQQARRIAQAGRVEGVIINPETAAILCDFPYGMSFALEYARARWAGGTERAAAATALAASLEAGPSSAIQGLISARLGPAHRVSSKSASTEGALSGTASSPLGRGVTQGALRSLSSIAGPVGYGHAGLFAGASPLASTVAIGVANLDFYRAALERSISWTQFTKNMIVKTSGIVIGTGGWASGAALGSAVAGPFGALFGGLVGALSGGSIGAVGAKRVADRFIEDDAMRLLTIVRQRAEKVAFEYMLTGDEVESFAARLKADIDAAWLRRLFRSIQAADGSGSAKGQQASFRLVDCELETMCKEILERRPYIVLPSAKTVSLLLEEIGLLDPDNTESA